MTRRGEQVVVWAGWLISRLSVLWLLLVPHAWVAGDVAYFADSLSALPEEGLDQTLVEYPLPGIVLVAVPWLMAQGLGQPEWYAGIVAGLAALADALFLLLVSARRGAGSVAGRRRAVGLWLLAVPMLGATTYARFDLVPGVLAGAAVLLLAGRPRWTAAAAAVATAVKLWPALLLPALAAPRAGRAGVVKVVGAVGILSAAVTVAVAGWARLLSPLVWQQERGLQVEAVLATPAMLGWAFAPADFRVGFSDFHAYEVHGPGVDVLLGLSTVLVLLLAAALVGAWAVAWRRGRSMTPEGVAWLCLAAVTAFMVSGKVLSPQYLLWLLPVAAAALAVARTERGVRQLSRWGAALLVCTGLTQLVFPVFYGAITVHRPESLWVVLLLATRNAILVWLLVVAVRECRWHLSRAHRGSALERQPAGPDG